MTSAAECVEVALSERLLALDIELEAIGSPTFQVTTFANTGPSFYVDRRGRLSVVVDSVASVANQLEQLIWNDATDRPAEPVAALPWVRVIDQDGQTYTTSRLGAHRLNAHALFTGTLEPEGEVFETVFKQRLGEPPPPTGPPLAAALWEFDPLTLVHGVWFPAVWDGRARITRALSGRIDAHDVQTQSVQVGGQKTADSLPEVSQSQARDGGKTVPGEVPVHMSEVSAAEILARFVLDIRLLRSYRLGEARERALAAVALLQIAEMVEAWPRRRSRCALDVVRTPVSARRPEGWELPPAAELRELAREACESATNTQGANEPRVVRHVIKR